MATFGHIAAGLALSRLAPRRDADRPAPYDVAVIVVAAAVPDVDFLLPVEHRTMTHSVGFAAAVGAGVALAYLPYGVRRGLVMGALGAVTTSSHAVLDVLTGESGTEAAWPATEERVSLPEAPLPVMPIDRELLSGGGLLKTLGELAWSAPLALIGLWPWLRRSRR